MAKLHNVSSSPHFRAKADTRSIMLDVVLALIPASAIAVFRFGFYALAIIAVTVGACVLSEYLWNKLMKKPQTAGDLSAVVTGLILALNMPPQIPLWIPALGGVFAIIVVKQLYGGIGQNFMNPALAARCFLLISFAGMMNNFTCAKIGFDAVSGATPLAAAASGNLSTYSTLDLFLGNIPGTIGEVSKLALLVGGAYLVITKVISPRIPLTYIGVFSVFVLFFKGGDLSYLLYELLSGGLIFGAFFMATDYATSPITKKGQYVFAAILGIFTGVFRLYGGSPEGVSYAIILSNLLVPLIEKYTMPKAFGKRGK
ncbi:MAG: RnfABCDGE type electron transport complex subunit D [Eubacteriales bacterium]|nr:RnfABCDGE type electron transport complex subunit D [Eubacteriales bacterium]